MPSKRSWLVGAALLAATCAFYPGAWLGRAPARGDVPTQFLPWKTALRDALSQGELPFWNPYTFCGAPLLANMQSAVLYPIDLALLPLPPGRAYGVSLALHALLAMAGAWLLARRLGADRDAALLPAVAYAYSGWNAIHLFAGNLLNLFSCAWVPWLWFVLLAEGWRRIAGTALVVALMVLCGYPQTLFYALLLGLLLQLAMGPTYGRTQAAYEDLLPGKEIPSPRGSSRACREIAAGRAASDVLTSPIRPRIERRRFASTWLGTALQGLGASVLGILWGLCLGAVQLAPTAMYLLQSGRSEPLPWMAATEFSLAPSHLICFLLPHCFGNQVDGTYTGHWWDWSNPYAGVAVIVLAGIALLQLERRRKWPLAAVALLALLLSMGRYSGVYWLFYHAMPLADRFRAPVRFLPFTILCLGALAALAWTRMRSPSRRIQIALGLSGAGLLLSGRVVWSADIGLHPGRDIAWMLILAGCSLWALALRRYRWSGTALALLVVFDLAMLNRPFYPLGDADAAVASLARAFAAVPAGPEADRVLTPPMRAGLHNLAIPARRPNFSGYDPLYPGHFGWFVKQLSKSCDAFEDSADTLTFPMRFGADVGDCTPAWSRLALFNVKYAYTRHGLLELPALPRAWVSHWVEATSWEETLHQLFDLSEQPDWTAPVRCEYVQDVSATVDNGQDHVRIASYGYNRVEIDVNMAAPGVLVLADNWARGWRVRVDGERRPLLAVWEFLRGVLLDTGTHEVVFTYTPPGWTPGWITSLLAGIAWIALTVRKSLAGRYTDA